MFNRNYQFDLDRQKSDNESEESSQLVKKKKRKLLPLERADDLTINMPRPNQKRKPIKSISLNL